MVQLTPDPPVNRHAETTVSPGDGVLRMGRILGAGLRPIFADLRGAVRACLLPALLVLLAQGVFIEVARQSTDRGGERWGFFEALYVVISLMFENLHSFDVGIVALMIAIAFAYVMLAHRWLSRVLPDGTASQEGRRAPGGRFPRMLLITVICCAMAIAGLVGSVYLAFVVAMEGDIAAGILVFFLVLIFAIALVMDIALVLPMIAVTGTMGWIRLRKLAGRRTGRLALALTAAFVFSLVPLVLAGLPASLIGHLLEAVDGPTPGLATQASMAVYGIAGVIGCMMLMGSLAEAYRQLGGPGLGVPESVLAVFDDA
ncbi:MAG: hypothetical protein AAF563_22035 [Pseudomonadota bacterium]